MKSKRKKKGVKKVSQIDDFMSQVIDLTETEKEEVIKYLASALSSNLDIHSQPSNNVLVIILPFMCSCLVKNIKEEEGEKIEKRIIQLREESKEN